MISTVPDMARWVKAYVNGTTNSAASQRDRLRCAPIAAHTKMAFGMALATVPDGTAIRAAYQVIKPPLIIFQRKTLH